MVLNLFKKKATSLSFGIKTIVIESANNEKLEQILVLLQNAGWNPVVKEADRTAHILADNTVPAPRVDPIQRAPAPVAVQPAPVAQAIAPIPAPVIQPTVEVAQELVEAEAKLAEAELKLLKAKQEAAGTNLQVQEYIPEKVEAVK